MFGKDHLQKLYKLRRDLHQNPDLSGKEQNTIKKIIDFVKAYHPHKIITELGRTGAAFVFEGINKGNTIIIRADIDALPIQEDNKFEYASVKNNTAHLCGHDGHMTIVAGLAKILSENKPEKGKVVLLFQPAEETGEGAKMILADKKFHSLEPKLIFALHNLPSFNKNEIVIKSGSFASASVGIIIKLTGISSHASEPENGLSPASAMTEIINTLNKLSITNKYSNGTFITVIHAKLGEKAFGTLPSDAIVMATLRSSNNNDFDNLNKDTVKAINEISHKHNIKCDIKWTEDFNAVENDNDCVKLIENAALENNLIVKTLEKPFRWSEDFGLFTNIYRGAMFGLGSGKDCPPLHNSKYDFPEDIIETGIKMFYSIIRNSL